MVSKDWYKVMARSHYDGMRWVWSHPEDQKDRSVDFSQKVSIALQKLRVASLEATEIFNHYSPAGAQITPLILAHPKCFDRVIGIKLLRYSLQLKMILTKNMQLSLELANLGSFQPQYLAKSTLQPQEDDMGCVVWHTPHGQIWDEDQLLKSAMKLLVKHESSCEDTFLTSHKSSPMYQIEHKRKNKL